jgi:ribokinase
MAGLMPAASAHNSVLVVFGEFFLDLVFYDLPRIPRLGEEVKTRSYARFPGGGLATTALVASALGTPTKVITRVGRDAVNGEEWKKLVRAGISTKGCQFDQKLPTAMTVCAAFNGDRMMITHDAINQHLEKMFREKRARAEILSARHLHMACSMWPPAVWISLLAAARRRGLSLSADIGWNPEVFQSPQLRRLLGQFEFLFPNEQEAKAIAEEKSVEAAAKTLAKWVPTPVIKLGKDGSLTIRDGKILRVRSILVRAVDATGSGDAFNGGFLHGHLAGWPIEDCLRAGNICGGLAATAPGGSSAIPTRKKLLELMEKLH